MEEGTSGKEGVVDAYRVLLLKAIRASDQSRDLEADFDSALNIEIRLRGEEWDERIDARVARYIIDLQNALDLAQSRLLDRPVKQRERILVKARLKKSSTLIKVELSDFFRKITETMSGSQLVFTICFVALVAGLGYTATKIATIRSNMAAKAQDEQTKRALAEAANAVSLHAVELAKPVRTIIREMRPGDTIELPDSEEPETRDEAIQRFPRARRTPLVTTYCDGEYAVRVIRLDPPVKVEISQGTREISAELVLPPDKVQLFAKIVHQATDGQGTKMNLGVTIRHTDRTIREARIVDMDIASPRETSRSLEDVYGFLEKNRQG
jgi:hypothetical protein